MGPRLSVARGDAGAIAVAESLPNLRQLKVLLYDNGIGPGLEVC